MPATREFVYERDSSALNFQRPVFELLGGKLWPVVCIELNGLLFVSVPLVESRGDQRPKLIEVPSIPAAVAWLEKMAEVVGTDTKELTETSQKIAELYQYICLSGPLGTPMETTPTALRHLAQRRSVPTPMPKQKQPAWVLDTVRSGSRLSLSVREEIRAVQYDKLPDVLDVWETYGTIVCKAELEGCPDVSLIVSSPPGSPPLDYLLVHPSVQMADVQHISSSLPDLASRKIRFTPPTESITLCHYKVTPIPYLPIRGFYQMKGDKSLTLLVQLKLNDSVKNSFEYCEVHIPFFNRGPVEKIEDVSVSPPSLAPALTLAPDKKKLVWNIGQKFPAKTPEVALQATVSFPSDPLQGTDPQDDPFCVQQNAYINILFKVTDFTLSGCGIDTRSVSLYPSTKCKVTLAKELSTSEYRIWNSHGDVKTGIAPVI
eukprot:Em0019g668a